MTFDELVKEIIDYDSDTFFGRGSDITLKEAKAVAERAIQYFFDNRLDGVLLEQFLYEIRNPGHA